MRSAIPVRFIGLVSNTFKSSGIMSILLKHNLEGHDATTQSPISYCNNAYIMIYKVVRYKQKRICYQYFVELHSQILGTDLNFPYKIFTFLPFPYFFGHLEDIGT